MEVPYLEDKSHYKKRKYPRGHQDKEGEHHEGRVVEMMALSETC
jgi:hypothetical protein